MSNNVTTRPRQSHLNGDHRLNVLIGHGLQVTCDAAISVGIDLGAEASGNFLLDFAHPQTALAAIIA